MIRAANVSKYRMNEFIQFMSNVLMIVNQHGADKLKLKALYQALQQQFQSLEAAYKQSSNSELTPQLAALDKRRDQAIVCLRQLCGGYMHHYDEKKLAASQAVLNCIDKYGNGLYKLNYNAETAALKKLIRDLQSDPICAQALQELQLQGVVDEMNQANTEFEALFVQRLEAFSQQEIKSTKELNLLTSEAYRNLVQHVEAHAVLTPTEAYLSLISHLNENVDHFNEVVERRKGSIGIDTPDVVADQPMDSPAV